MKAATKSDTKVKVLYIAGSGRSGTTLLARLLGEIEGFVNTGEAVRYLSDEMQYLVEVPCGCGKSVAECPFWREIVNQVPPDVSRLGARLVRMRTIASLSWRATSGRLTHEHRVVLEGISTGCREICRRTGGSILVDSSKNPSSGFALSLLPEIELYVVHLVRNPVGVVTSWRKPKGYLPALPMRKVLAWWWSYNVLSERLKDRAHWYRRYRFEDFAEHPRDVLQEIASAVTGRPVALPFLDQKSAFIGTQHSLLGNPDKLRPGKVTISPAVPAAPWRRRMFIHLATFPLMWRYGYLPSWRVDFRPVAQEAVRDDSK